MQDRFKFRAYNKELKKMYEVDTICPYEDNHTKGGEVFLKGIQYNSFYFPEEAEVMQCTGQKDKNGKLIYEGDILEDPVHKFEVGWNEYSFVISGASKKGEEKQVYFFPLLARTFKVIGNIYQNPELLED